MRIKSVLRVIVYGGTLALLAWAFWIEPDSLRVNEYTLELEGWPQSQDGLRIAVISDIHAGSPWIDEDKLRKIVRVTRQTQPDLILLAGDFVINDVLGGHYMEPERIAPALSGLQAPLGVYAVPGNHEHRREVIEAMREQFAQQGIRMVDGQLLRIHQGRHDFWLAGFDNLPHGIGKVKTWMLPVYADTVPLIALAHDPISALLLPPSLRARTSLFVAGHTHGGQVYLPLIGAPMLKGKHLSEAAVYRRGFYRISPNLFVTSGIGTSNLGARLGVPPEIALLTLHHAGAAP